MPPTNIMPVFRKKPPEKVSALSNDRLLKAFQSRQSPLEIGGTSIMLSLWTVRQGWMHAATIADLIKASTSQLGKGDLQDMLLTGDIDFSALLDKNGSKILEILADTVVVGNFEDTETALCWIEELSIVDIVTLLTEIWQRNFSTLGKKLAALGIKFGSSAAQKTPTSLTNSSAPATPKSESSTDGPSQNSKSTGWPTNDEKPVPTLLSETSMPSLPAEAQASSPSSNVPSPTPPSDSTK